ncbi:putative cell-cycle-associated protein kinase DYRK2 [Besnoitia besnoiti]|uniref:Putative cell-cycle-associated protein kinase DYRK2 n=1 Tax=Besnoitia besnoiti TaxID=94643 RepID=A0A2A9M4G9_BESBE|nr:putative cell-cycle-associated protein kinase DYRK2 [Besnoitia besnoiti]PFH33378.1 putative cell-cycle-associated protein kinase DYRK2 [Besnoitia besnoiti]
MLSARKHSSCAVDETTVSRSDPETQKGSFCLNKVGPATAVRAAREADGYRTASIERNRNARYSIFRQVQSVPLLHSRTQPVLPNPWIEVGFSDERHRSKRPQLSSDSDLSPIRAFCGTSGSAVPGSPRGVPAAASASNARSSFASERRMVMDSSATATQGSSMAMPQKPSDRSRLPGRRCVRNAVNTAQVFAPHADENTAASPSSQTEIAGVNSSTSVAGFPSSVVLSRDSLSSTLPSTREKCISVVNILQSTKCSSCDMMACPLTKEPPLSSRGNSAPQTCFQAEHDCRRGFQTPCGACPSSRCSREVRQTAEFTIIALTRPSTVSSRQLGSSAPASGSAAVQQNESSGGDSISSSSAAPGLLGKLPSSTPETAHPFDQVPDDAHCTTSFNCVHPLTERQVEEHALRTSSWGLHTEKTGRSASSTASRDDGSSNHEGTVATGQQIDPNMSNSGTPGTKRDRFIEPMANDPNALSMKRVTKRISLSHPSILGKALCYPVSSTVSVSGLRQEQELRTPLHFSSGECCSKHRKSSDVSLSGHPLLGIPTRQELDRRGNGPAIRDRKCWVGQSDACEDGSTRAPPAACEVCLTGSSTRPCQDTSKRTLMPDLRHSEEREHRPLHDATAAHVTAVQDAEKGAVQSTPQNLAEDHGKKEAVGSSLQAINRESVAEEGPTAHTAKTACTELPLTGKELVKRHGAVLTAFEQAEALEVREVWYWGKSREKPSGETARGKGGINHGFDDARGDYLASLRDHVNYRFELIAALGKGSFGHVFKAFDHKTGEYVALKVVRNKKHFHAQGCVEVSTLQKVLEGDKDERGNVIHMKEHFIFRSHLVITFELLDINLYEFLKRNTFRGLSSLAIRSIGIQLLQALRLLKRHRIVHCDLKPENIVLKNKLKSSIKVIDFGSSCPEGEMPYSYIQSRFYRSPEVLLGLSYGCPIDMWSLGCVLAELHNGHPLFAGENEKDQINCMMEILGPPPMYIIAKSPRRRLFFDSAGDPKPHVNSHGKGRRPSSADLSTALQTDDEPFVDFIRECLHWDPVLRITPEQALQHRWVKQFKTMRKQKQLENKLCHLG